MRNLFIIILTEIIFILGISPKDNPWTVVAKPSENTSISQEYEFLPGPSSNSDEKINAGSLPLERPSASVFSNLKQFKPGYCREL